MSKVHFVVVATTHWRYAAADDAVTSITVVSERCWSFADSIVSHASVFTMSFRICWYPTKGTIGKVLNQSLRGKARSRWQQTIQPCLDGKAGLPT